MFKKEIVNEKRQILIKLYNEGVKISKIARILIIEKSTVSRIVKRFLTTGVITTLPKGNNRSAVISNGSKIYIKRFFDEDATLSFRKIKILVMDFDISLNLSSIHGL
ncbi:hypothetical protein DMUE_3125 [Dictyocoela muelleri]|nr:hypothetical protein DMUE_3125 [Dictyocoela muelleri]